MQAMPPIAWKLGYAGALPFAALTLALLLGWTQLGAVAVAHWLALYAALIASFLGAVHWGVALGLGNRLDASTQQKLFGFSVLPSLLAWLALLLPDNLALLALGALIILAWLLDQAILFPALDSDYRRLRTHLTLIVSTLLFAAGVAIT